MKATHRSPRPTTQATLLRLRRRTRALMLFELAWPALWPALGVAGLFLCAALLQLPQSLPPLLHILLLGLVLATVAGLLVRGLRGLSRPTDASADRRLERVSGLSHRPLAVLADQPASDDAAGAALWRLHAARAVLQVRHLRVGLPHPGLAMRDRWAIRGALVVALAACVGIAGGDAPSRLLQAMAPGWPVPTPRPEPQLQGWITPPSYTDLPPVFLKAEGGAVVAPAGSHLTVNITGGEPNATGSHESDPALVLDGHAQPFQALDAASFQADTDLTTGGRLAIRRQDREMAGWDLTIVADTAPTVVFPEPPGRLPRSVQTRLPWRTAHQYGVVSLQAELRLQDRPDAPPLLVTIPLPAGRTKAAHGVQLQDLSAHPWAGLNVAARLVARDAAGQQGVSETAEFALPERNFENPVARALIALRRAMSLRPDDRAAAVAGLQVIADAPDRFNNDTAIYLTLSATAALLDRDADPHAVAEAQDRMWQMALRLEDGALEQTSRALQQARDAAHEALDKARREPSAEHQAALDRKLQELQAAIQKHLQAMLDQQRRQQGDQSPPQSQAERPLDKRDLDQMAEQARDAAREGRMEDAQQKLAELEKLLDALKNAQAGQKKGQDQKKAGQRQRGKQDMGALQDLVRRQGGLLDHAQTRSAATEAPQAPAPMPGDLEDQGAPAGPSAKPTAQDSQRDADRRVQQALRRALGELMQQVGDLTGSVPKSLGEADTAMRDAGQALAHSQDIEAGRDAQHAIEALQKGGRDMDKQMAEQFGSPSASEDAAQADDGGGDEQDGQDGQSGNQPRNGKGRRGQMRADGQRGQGQDAHRDPLGRHARNGATGVDDGTDVSVPDDMEQQRTRAIQDELRRRGAERERPAQELDYIGRLLKQF